MSVFTAPAAGVGVRNKVVKLYKNGGVVGITNDHPALASGAVMPVNLTTAHNSITYFKFHFIFLLNFNLISESSFSPYYLQRYNWKPSPNAFHLRLSNSRPIPLGL
jgi:hypothetical protein